MLKSIYMKTEFKKIFREPIMALLLFVPLLIPVLFRLMITFLVPFILKYVYFDFTLYQSYVLSFTLLLSPMLLSIIIGFSMIDDRDNRIVELMSVTPMGKSGYLMMRLSLIFMFVILYSVYSYFVLGIFIVSIYTVLYIALLMCIYSGVMGLLLFSVATDKVNGLTYAKGMNIVCIFAFVDLLNIKWLSAVGWLFPPYWVTQIITSPTNIFPLIMGGMVSVFWFVLLLVKTKF